MLFVDSPCIKCQQCFINDEFSTGLSRRGVNTGPALTPLPSTLEDPSANWKGTPTGGPESQNNGNFSGTNPNFTGPVFPPAGQGSPAPTGAPNYQPAPGSNTPQYTASPAPSGIHCHKNYHRHSYYSHLNFRVFDTWSTTKRRKCWISTAK